MFEPNHLAQLDDKYFSLLSDPYDIVLQSKNTGHYWILHDPVDSSGTIVIFHTHTRKDKFHKQGYACSLKHAVRTIQRHDLWQMRGRLSYTP